MRGSYPPVIYASNGDIKSLASSTQSVGDDSSGYVAFPTAANQWVDLGSISIPVGTWDIYVQAGLNSNGATTTGDVFLGIGTTAGDNGPGTVGIDYVGQVKTTTSGSENSLSMAKFNVTVSSTTTYYAKAYAVTSITNLQIAHKLFARRVIT